MGKESRVPDDYVSVPNVLPEITRDPGGKRAACLSYRRW